MYVYHKIFKYIKNLLITAEGKYLPHDQSYKNLMGNRCDNWEWTPTQHVGLVQSRPNVIISLKINLFSPWYSWKIAGLALKNNYSLTPGKTFTIWVTHGCLIRKRNCLLFTNTWVHTPIFFLMGFVLFIFFVLWQLLLLSLDFPFSIVASVSDKVFIVLVVWKIFTLSCD